MIRFLTVLLFCVIPTIQSHGQGGLPIHQGSIEAFQNSGPLTVSLTKDQTVTYTIQLSSNYLYGSSVLVEGFNNKGTSLFQITAYTGFAGSVQTVTLPAGLGHLVPYRGTAHAVGRPASLVVTSMWAQVSYSVFESKTDRQDYNEGGVTRAQAKQIGVFETVKGNVHQIEGDEVRPGDGTEPGGQWFKVTLEPRQTIRPYGWALGHPNSGAAFTIRLHDEAGTYLMTLLSIAAYGNTPFPSTQAPGSYLFQNTSTQPKTFYLQVYSKIGIVHDFEFELYEIKMEFLITSQTINKQTNYSEDSMIQIQAVRGDTRAPLPDFSGNVSLAEINGNAYAQNGGSVPSTVQIPAGSGGKAEFVAKSLVGPKSGQTGQRHPDAAEIRCSNFRQLLVGAAADDSPLRIEQWFYTANATATPPSVGRVPDWLQARVNDLFGRPDLTDADRAARDAVASYTVEDLGSRDGEASIALSPTCPLKLNPFKHQGMRLNQSWVGGECGPLVTFRYLTATLFHEARHCYQGSQASIVAKNVDRDLLINALYEHAATDAPVDSISPRVVCDGDFTIRQDWTYHGDSTIDQLDSPDYARWGLEFDAYWFMTIGRTY